MRTSAHTISTTPQDALHQKPWAKLQGRRGFIPGVLRADVDLIKANIGRNTRGAGALAVYIALARLLNDNRSEYPQGNAVPIPISTLAEAAGLPERTTIRRRSDLVNIGLLRLDHQKTDVGSYPFGASLHTLTPSWTPRGVCRRGNGGSDNDSASRWHNKERSSKGAKEEEGPRFAHAGPRAGLERPGQDEKKETHREPRRFET